MAQFKVVVVLLVAAVLIDSISAVPVVDVGTGEVVDTDGHVMHADLDSAGQTFGFGRPFFPPYGYYPYGSFGYRPFFPFRPRPFFF